MNDEKIILLTESEVSEITGRSISILRKERMRNIGIPFIKFGRQVKYDIEDVKKYIDEHRIETKK